MDIKKGTTADGITNGETDSQELGDFTTTLRVLPISALATVIGVLCAFVALALLRLIGLFTNLFYFGRWSAALVSPVTTIWAGSRCWFRSAARFFPSRSAPASRWRRRGHLILERVAAPAAEPAA